MQVIEVVVSPRGETIIRTQGYTGNACLEASKWLEQTLGTSVHDHKTAEFYQNSATEQTVNQE